MAPGVSDEVWRRLDPRAGALGRRTVLLNWVAIATAALIVIAGTLVWRSGVIVPRLVWPSDSRAWALDVSGLARIDVAVANAGWAPVTVLDVGRSAPGFELLRVDGGSRERPAANPFPVTLQPGEGVGVVLVYQVSDCDSPPRGEWPVTAQVQRPWGVVTVEVRNDRGPMEPWQEQVVDLWCDPQAWPID